MSDINHGRRQFLAQGSALAAGIAIAPGMLLFDFAHARPAGVPASSAVRWGMLIDTTQCESGCDACVTACRKENGWPEPKTAQDVQWIRKVEIKQISTGKQINLPMMCQHCAEPPCVDVCPTAASFKRADGIVLVDKHRCIGCRYCMMACPYQARSFVHEPVVDHSSEMPRGQGTVESCTLCVDRVDRGEQPACVESCAKEGHKALVFGDLNNPNSEISQRIRSVASIKLREDLGLDTAFSFVGL
ncbi:MAG TPA: 4Fe-4S dicluster domain-containing protein [Gallionellaceae bacterium]|nr:4Fe-4S dicluster domain-containing protein [Gallionellaceae bacterium]